MLGPGVITGASDDDPSGIGTYSVAGAQFGYGTVWASLVTYFLSAAVQEVCARIGLVTGHGLAAIIKHYFPRWVLYGVAFLLVAANTLNIGADIAAMAGSIHLVLPVVPTALAALLVVSLTLTLLVTMSYKTYSKYLKWVALVLFSYLIVAFLSHVDWGVALKSLVVPAIKLDAAYITTLVAILGTTISPYMFFWQANMEVEEKIASGSLTSPDPQMKRPRSVLDQHRSFISFRTTQLEIVSFSRRTSGRCEEPLCGGEESVWVGWNTGASLRCAPFSATQLPPPNAVLFHLG